MAVDEQELKSLITDIMPHLVARREAFERMPHSETIPEIASEVEKLKELDKRARYMLMSLVH